MGTRGWLTGGALAALFTVGSCGANDQLARSGQTWWQLVVKGGVKNCPTGKYKTGEGMTVFGQTAKCSDRPPETPPLEISLEKILG